MPMQNIPVLGELRGYGQKKAAMKAAQVAKRGKPVANPNFAAAQQLADQQQAAQTAALMKNEVAPAFGPQAGVVQPVVQPVVQQQPLPAGPNFTGNPEDYAGAWNQLP